MNNHTCCGCQMTEFMNTSRVWVYDPDGYWKTGCGEAFQISEGGPAENGMLFCYHCGHPLKEES